MARKYSLFNFLEKKVETAEISPVTQQILDQIAFKELALHIGISYIANTLSKCEFKTFVNGKEVKDTLYYKLNISPNPNKNSSQFINQFVEQCFYYGSALVVKQNEDLYCADNFDIDDDNPMKEDTFYNVTFNCYTLKKKQKASEVFFFQLNNDNVKVLIDSLYNQYSAVIGQALAAYKRTNGAKYKMILERYQAGDSEFNKIFNDVLKKQLQTFVENDNAVYPKYSGIDLQEFQSSASPKDTSDIISMRKETFEVVAQALKIPLSMMYGNITNMKEIRNAFLSDCIDPLADMIGEEITRKYYTFDEWKNGCEVVVDTTCVNHIDLFEIMANVDKGIASGFVCVDETRKAAGLRELKTDFSTSYFMTKNYMPAEDMLNLESGKGGE
jgi:HK97 family phage portal protein